MIFTFYDKFFPGITIHKKGFVSVDELDTIYQGALLVNYDRKRKYWSRLEVTFSSHYFNNQLI